MDDGRSNLWRRHEGRAVHNQRDPRRAAPLRSDGEAAVRIGSGLCDDPLGDFLLEHQGERPPPRRPWTFEPFQKQRRPDIVRQVRNDVGALAGEPPLVDCERVTLDDLEATGELGLELGESRKAAAVALDADDLGSGLEQRSGQAARSRTHLIDGLAGTHPRDRGDPGEQVAVEDEILAERLARPQAMPADDVAQRLGPAAHGISEREAAQSPAIRMAAAIGRGSARSWPAISNAVP